MIVDLIEIEGASRPFDFVASPGELDLESPGFRLTGDVQVNGEVAMRAAQIDVKGSIHADAEVECARCLTALRHKLAVDFAVGYVTPENFSVEKEREVAPDDLDTDVLDSDRIDLKEVAREQILLNLPEQVFCKPDCKGLCRKCGADLNLIDCNCDLDETDPRWAALKNLR